MRKEIADDRLNNDDEQILSVDTGSTRSRSKVSIDAELAARGNSYFYGDSPNPERSMPEWARKARNVLATSAGLAGFAGFAGLVAVGAISPSTTEPTTSPSANDDDWQSTPLAAAAGVVGIGGFAALKSKKLLPVLTVNGRRNGSDTEDVEQKLTSSAVNRWSMTDGVNADFYLDRVDPAVEDISEAANVVELNSDLNSDPKEDTVSQTAPPWFEGPSGSEPESEPGVALDHQVALEHQAALDREAALAHQASVLESTLEQQPIPESLIAPARPMAQPVELKRPAILPIGDQTTRVPPVSLRPNDVDLLSGDRALPRPTVGAFPHWSTNQAEVEVATSACSGVEDFDLSICQA